MSIITLNTRSIPDSAITTAKINADAITSAKIADDAVVTAAIADDAVVAASLADNAVSLATSTVTGTLPTANGGTGATSFSAGKVLQVSNLVRATSTQTIATTTYTDLTSLSLSITPSSTSNKILIVANIQGEINDNEGFGIRFLRDSTNIYDAGNQELAGHQSGASVVLQVVNAVHIDSPSSTSAITYKVQSATRSGSSVNFNDGYYSEFYLMEIAG